MSDSGLNDPRRNKREDAEWFDYDAIDGNQSNRECIDDELEHLKKTISFIRAQPRARLTVDCLYIALNDHELDGLSMTEIARQHGMTKAAISVRVKEIQSKLHIQKIKSRYQKSPEASTAYATSNRRNHATRTTS